MTIKGSRRRHPMTVGSSAPAPVPASVILAKAKLATAPLNPASISYMGTAPSYTIGATNAYPPLAGWDRHYIGPTPQPEIPDWDTQVTSHMRSVWAPGAGGSLKYQWNDGMQTHAYLSNSVSGVVYDDSVNYGFRHTGRYLSIAGMTPDSTQIIVNGNIAFKTGALGRTGASQYANIDFGTAASRNIIVLGSAGSSAGDIVTGPEGTILPWNWLSSEMKVSFQGDSFFQSTSSANGTGLTMNQLMGTLMGSYATNLCGIGGSGYATPNVGNPTAYPKANSSYRITAVTQGNPDVIVTCLGINDQYPTSVGGDFDTNVSQYYDNIRAASPSSLMVAVGPWCPQGSVAGVGKFANIRNSIKSILATKTGPWIFIDNLTGAWYTSSGKSGTDGGQWQTGDGNTGTPTGSGNGDLYVGPDGTHPSIAGYVYLATRFGSAYRAAVTAF